MSSKRRYEALLGTKEKQKPYNLPKIQSKSLTDLEKWKKHLDEMKIRYDIDDKATLKNEQVIVLLITHHGYFVNQIRGSIYIIFDTNGNFKSFEANE